MKTIKISLIMAFALLLTVGVFAQRGRGNNNNRYRPNNHSNYNRNHFSVTVGPRYNYLPVLLQTRYPLPASLPAGLQKSKGLCTLWPFLWLPLKCIAIWV